MAMNKYLSIILFVFTATMTVQAQNRYMVFFKDKNGTPFQTTAPGEFLSSRAIARRLQQNVEVTQQDLPVNPAYVAGVKNTGASIYFQTRWLNGLLIQCQPELVSSIEALAFVERVEFVAPNPKLMSSGRKKERSQNRSTQAVEVTDDQLIMLGVDRMHGDGYHGEDRVIAILDAGFEGVNTAGPFQHLFQNNQVDLTVSQDFVYNSNDVFQYDDHGTFVFSTLSALEPGTFTGSAHKATYQLYVTEEVPTEYRIEEYNWLFAAERADSAGADIIQASLGYSDFDGTTMDYAKSDLDGKTTVVSRAAQWAADRGIIVVCSAGNEGNNAWQMITSPADAVDVLAVANVNREGVRSGSSSIGPSADQRIKPDVAALGTATAVIGPNGTVGNVSGTSLASPLITGLVAGIWQRFPDLTAREIMAAIRFSASQASSPDNLTGFGIPNYTAVVNYLEHEEQKHWFEVFPNPSSFDTLIVRPKSPETVTDCRIELFNAQGKSLFTKDVKFSWNVFQYETSIQGLSGGTYFLKIFWNNKTFVHKVVRL
jgi:serine protease AprX